MGKLNVTYAGHLSDRVQALYYGTVNPEGIDLHFIPLSPSVAFHRMMVNREFDVSEMSFSTYIASVARGECPFIAIPVFPHRVFRHSSIYLNKNSGIGEPGDLSGRKVGVPEYQMTAGLWARGFLLDDYGIRPEEIKWVTGGLINPGREQLITTEIPGVAITHVADRSLESLLVQGEIDALISARIPDCFRSQHPDITRLFPNYLEIEQDYYSRTGLFPIMHTVVLQKDFYQRYPWAAVSLYQAFDQAKNLCLHSLNQQETLPVSLPWLADAVASTRELMGLDFWPYGLEQNRKVIEAMCRYSYEQGISPRLVEPRELFATNVIDLDATTRV